MSAVPTLEQLIALGGTTLAEPRTQSVPWRYELEWMVRELKEIRDGKRDRFSKELKHQLADSPLPRKDEAFFKAYLLWSDARPIDLQR